MKCTICKSKNIDIENAEFRLPQHNLKLCRDHYIEWFERMVERTIKHFKMFTKDDKILVAVSGGKDSMVLWFVLNRLGYNADGMFINLGIGEYSIKSMNKVKKMQFFLLNNLGVNRKLTILDLSKELGAPLPVLTKYSKRAPCSLCGYLKRYFMNKLATKEDYNVIVTGHNLTDETTTLLANLITWNIKYLSRKKPVLEERDGFPRKAKPLSRLRESEILIYKDIFNIDIVNDKCPFSLNAKSYFYRDIINSLDKEFSGIILNFYNKYADIYSNLFSTLSEKEEIQGFKKGNLNKCKVCGEPTPGEVCLACRLKNEIKNLK